MAHWDVSSELRGEHGKWSKRAALKRIAESAQKEVSGKAESALKEGERVKYKTGATGVVHHIDEKGVPHIVWDRGRGKPVRTPAQHLTSLEKPELKEPAQEKLPFIKVRERVLSLKEGEPEVINGHKIELLQNGQYEVDLGGTKARYDYPHQAAGAIRAGFHLSDAHPPRDIQKEMTLRETLGAPLPEVHHPAKIEFNRNVKATEEQKKKMRLQVIAASSKQGEVTPKMVSDTHIVISETPHGARRTSRTLASHSGAGSLHVKPEVLVGSNTDRVLEHNKKSEWWVPTDFNHDLSMNIMTHEYGHGTHGVAVKAGLFQSHRDHPTTTSPVEMGFWKNFAKAIGANEPQIGVDGYGRKYMNVGTWLSRNKQKISSAVSQYGSSNQNEMFAEMWTEYRLNTHPRPAAKLYGDYVTKGLEGKG